MIENPQSFIVSTECNKAAKQNGFRRQLSETDGWAAFQSTTVQGTIWLAAEGRSGPWYLALDHSGVISEADLTTHPAPGPGIARFRFATLGELYRVLPRVYQLSVSLPDAPLRIFQTQTESLSKATDAERLVIQRIGQNVFRESLLEYWDHQCPLTGMSDNALLRASHVIPWKDCGSDSERLDVYNGLLLSALWDAAFDRGLVTFNDDGTPAFSNALGQDARTHLQWNKPLSLTANHITHLQWHRKKIFIQKQS